MAKNDIYATVQNALLKGDEVALKAILSTHHKKYFEAPKISSEELLSSVYDTNKPLSRNVSAECYVPRKALENRACTAIR